MDYNFKDPAFRKKVVHAHNGNKLPNQQAIVDLFGDIGLNKNTVKYWVHSADKARRKLFIKNPVGLIVSFDFIKRLVELLSEPEKFYSFKHIKVQLESEDKRAYTAGDISLATRTLLFSHLYMPFCFIYFISSLADDILKIGIAANYIKRWLNLETGSYSKFVVHLVLKFPLKYKWEVDQWFRDEYFNHRVYRESDSNKRPKKNRGEFYTWFVLEQFKDSESKVISIKTKEGNVSVNVALEKLLPDLQEFKKISSQLKILESLKHKRKQESKTRLAQDILDHPLLLDYPKGMRENQMIESFEEEDLTQNSSPVDSEQALLEKIAKGEEQLKELRATLERLQKSKPPL
jgi:hypothetical protein